MAYWDFHQIYIESLEDFEVKFDDYLSWCKGEDRIPTVQNLAYWLGEKTDTIRQCKNIEDLRGMTAFSHIKDKNELALCYVAYNKIMRKLEDNLGQRLLTSRNQVGAIFLMKNDFGYTDKKEIETNGSMEFTIDLVD